MPPSDLHCRSCRGFYAFACGTLCVAVALATACTHPIQIGQRGFDTDFVKGKVYKLKKDVLLEQDSALGNLPTLFVDDQSAEFINGYRADPAKWPVYLGVLDAGTRLRCEEFIFCDCVDGTGVTIAGHVLSGPWAGKRIALPSRRTSTEMNPRLPEDLLEIEP